MEHFVSCESHWSHWDSLYTLSEEELTSEEEGHRYQQFTRPHCYFCEEHRKAGLLLSDKLEVLENKNRCLLKIKSELTSQLTESNNLVEVLEKEIDELKLNHTVKESSHLHSTQDKIRTLYRKSKLHSIRKHVSKTPKKSISMPEKLDRISNVTKQKRENTLFAALKNKAKEISQKRIPKVDKTDIAPQAQDVSWNTLAKEVLEAQKDEESFVSRWSDVTVVI